MDHWTTSLLEGRCMEYSGDLQTVKGVANALHLGPCKKYFIYERRSLVILPHCTRGNLGFAASTVLSKHPTWPKNVHERWRSGKPTPYWKSDGDNLTGSLKDQSAFQSVNSMELLVGHGTSSAVAYHINRESFCTDSNIFSGYSPHENNAKIG